MLEEHTLEIEFFNAKLVCLHQFEELESCASLALASITNDFGIVFLPLEVSKTSEKRVTNRTHERCSEEAWAAWAVSQRSGSVWKEMKGFNRVSHWPFK